jgi:hypothetical protein
VPLHGVPASLATPSRALRRSITSVIYSRTITKLPSRGPLIRLRSAGRVLSHSII